MDQVDSKLIKEWLDYFYQQPPNSVLKELADTAVLNNESQDYYRGYMNGAWHCLSAIYHSEDDDLDFDLELCVEIITNLVSKAMIRFDIEKDFNG